jgi:hypothetical protein
MPIGLKFALALAAVGSLLGNVGALFSKEKFFMKKTLAVGCTAGLLMLAAVRPASATGILIHEYDLNGSLADNFAGPSLASNGGRWVRAATHSARIRASVCRMASARLTTRLC